MKLKTRFRITAMASLGATLVLALVLAWAFMATRKASENDGLAESLLQVAFERGLLRDEYLLLHEPRARAQWVAKTAQLEALLGHAAAEFETPTERRVVAEMAALLERSTAIFEELYRVGENARMDAEAPGPGGRFRERATSRLLLISHDLNGRARQLAASASARFESTLGRTAWTVVVLLGVVLAVSFTNARMAASVVERRVSLLRDGAEQVSAGNLDHRISVQGDDELAELGVAFDRMTARLQASYAALEVSNRELEAFCYAVSHDLRAPLRSISGFSQAVLEDYGGTLDATGRKYLEMASDGAREMGQLIDDLLGLSRVARAEMARLPVDLSALARSVTEDLRRFEPERRVEVAIAPDLVAQGDQTLLRLAVENLLRNAWKFTSRHATAQITFGGAASPAGDTFFVADDGAGFDMTYADKLFHPFQRLHRTSEFPGTGIGLATVNRIILRHGGRVSARGEVEKGATFTFTLPRTGEPHA